MSNKKFILNADGLGLNSAYNKAILEGYSYGILKSASLVANGDSFEDACTNVILFCDDLGIGVHLNLTIGKSLVSDFKYLTNSDGIFKNSYASLFIKLLNYKDDNLINEIEKEFRAQIERVMQYTTPTHIDSVDNIHTIPRLFELVCKLSKEYKIDRVRSNYEKAYFIPDIYRHFNLKYPINVAKTLFFNTLTLINEKYEQKYSIKTNDYFIGSLYLNLMNSLVISYGLMAIKYDKVTVEACIHPCRYDDGKVDEHFRDFMITRNKKLIDKIEKIGYQICNYKENEEFYEI